MKILPEKFTSIQELDNKEFAKTKKMVDKRGKLGIFRFEVIKGKSGYQVVRFNLLDVFRNWFQSFFTKKEFGFFESQASKSLKKKVKVVRKLDQSNAKISQQQKKISSQKEKKESQNASHGKTKNSEAANASEKRGGKEKMPTNHKTRTRLFLKDLPKQWNELDESQKTSTFKHLDSLKNQEVSSTIRHLKQHFGKKDYFVLTSNYLGEFSTFEALVNRKDRNFCATSIGNTFQLCKSLIDLSEDIPSAKKGFLLNRFPGENDISKQPILNPAESKEESFSAANEPHEEEEGLYSLQGYKDMPVNSKLVIFLASLIREPIQKELKKDQFNLDLQDLLKGFDPNNIEPLTENIGVRGAALGGTLAYETPVEKTKHVVEYFYKTNDFFAFSAFLEVSSALDKKEHLSDCFKKLFSLDSSDPFLIKSLEELLPVYKMGLTLEQVKLVKTLIPEEHPKKEQIIKILNA